MCYIKNTCPMCGVTKQLHLTKEEYSNYLRYLRREDLIQNLLPTLNSFEREFLISHYCIDCQTLIFGREAIIRPERW